MAGTASAASTSASTQHPPSRATELTTRNPLIEQRAGPRIAHPVGGMYYMTGSLPEHDRIVVRGAPTIDGLAHTRERTIWRRPESGRTGGHIWAPELHRIDTNSNLSIAEMSSPLSIKGEPVRIAVPTHDWETRGFAVNEGPAALVRNGRVLMTFSASATDANYCMGLLTADARANMLGPASWTKPPRPVFTTNDNTGQFGPGHNTFTVAEDGATDVLV